MAAVRQRYAEADEEGKQVIRRHLERMYPTIYVVDDVPAHQKPGYPAIKLFADRERCVFLRRRDAIEVCQQGQRVTTVTSKSLPIEELLDLAEDE